MQSLVERIDRLNGCIGRWVAWAALALVLIQALVVVLRYVFGLGFIWMQESVLYLHAALFMLGAGYCLWLDGHVRVDVLLERLSPSAKAWINLFTGLALVLPFVVVIGWYSWGYVSNAWAILEGSRETSGLPLTFLLKSLILAFCALLGLQGVSLSIRSAIALRGRS